MVKAVVGWWARALLDIRNRRTTQAAKNSPIALNPPFRDEDLITFMRLLADFLIPEIKQGRDFKLMTDYGAQDELLEIATAAGIPHDAFPLKTVMWVYPGSDEVTVWKAGQGKETPIFKGYTKS